MGLLGKIGGFVRDGIQEMLIQRPDEHKDLIVYKHPEPTIPMGAQLTVKADEAAVFFRDGALVGALRTAGAGQRHQLTSENLPFIGRLIDMATGGNIFVTDLYFVRMNQITKVPFGASLGSMVDPMLGEMVTPRIYGKFSFEITDPRPFLIKYVGLNGGLSNEEVIEWIKDHLNATVKTVIGQVCQNEQKSLLQLMPLQSQLAKTFEQYAPELSEIGIKILKVADFNINFDDDDKARLEEAQAEIGKAQRQARIAKIGIAQAEAEAAQKQFGLDQDFSNDQRYVKELAGGDFTRMAAGKAMIGAGEGMAQGGGGEGGGNMMAGAGMGVGFGMAHAFAGGMVPQQAPPPAVQAQHGAAVAGAAGMVQCGGCGAQSPGGKFCSNCGTSLTPQPKICGACNTENGPTAKFCNNCGTNLGG